MVDAVGIEFGFKAETAPPAVSVGLRVEEVPGVQVEGRQVGEEGELRPQRPCGACPGTKTS